jgi:hypothetical protein
LTGLFCFGGYGTHIGSQSWFVDRATHAESFNAKVKAFRAQFRGVTDIPFFLYRLMKLCA